MDQKYGDDKHFNNISAFINIHRAAAKERKLVRAVQI